MLVEKNSLKLDFFGIGTLYDYLAYRLSTPKIISWNEILLKSIEKGSQTTADLAEKYGTQNVQQMIARASRLVYGELATMEDGVVTISSKGEYELDLLRRYIKANWDLLKPEHQVIIRKIMKQVTGLKTNDVETLLFEFVTKKIEIVNTILENSEFKFQATRLANWNIMSRMLVMEEIKADATPTTLTRALPNKRFETVAYNLRTLIKNKKLTQKDGLYYLSSTGREEIEKVVKYVNKRIDEYHGAYIRKDLLEGTEQIKEFIPILVQTDREYLEKIRLNATMKFPYRQELFEHPDIF